MKIIKFPSSNFFVSRETIKAVCLHGTAGPLWASIATLRNTRIDNPELAVSANYVVDLDGIVYELIDYTAAKRSYANGIVENYDNSIKWLDEAVKNKLNPNLCTYSIEHVASKLSMESHSPMTDAQFNTSIELTAMLLNYAGLKASHDTIIGHNQISGTIKYNCPGVIFPPAYTEVLINRFPELG